MKKMMMFAAVLAAVGMVAGCFTSATAYTETKHTDGSVTVSKVKVVGTGDKASEIAAEGLFADGTQDDLGAGVKTASASQTSTGIDGTLAGLGTVLQGMAQIMAGRTAAPAAEAGDAAQTAYAPGDGTAASGNTAYAPDGYTGTPGPAGEGVYGSPACGRCRAYRAAHPDVVLINTDVPGNLADLFAALRLRDYAGERAPLPVVVTADGYTLSAK